MRFQEIFRTAVTSGTPATAASSFIPTNFLTRTIQVTSTGVSAASVTISGSNDGVGRVNLGTFALTTAANSDGIVLNAPVNWRFLTVNVTSATGTGEVFVTTTSSESYKD